MRSEFQDVGVNAGHLIKFLRLLEDNRFVDELETVVVKFRYHLQLPFKESQLVSPTENNVILADALG